MSATRLLRLDEDQQRELIEASLAAVLGKKLLVLKIQCSIGPT
jgi:hypothetical protein